MYYMMIRDSAYAAGAHKVWIVRTRVEAERIARGLDTPWNGKPMAKTFILCECEYDDWYNNNVAALNNKNR